MILNAVRDIFDGTWQSIDSTDFRRNLLGLCRIYLLMTRLYCVDLPFKFWIIVVDFAIEPVFHLWHKFIVFFDIFFPLFCSSFKSSVNLFRKSFKLLKLLVISSSLDDGKFSAKLISTRRWKHFCDQQKYIYPIWTSCTRCLAIDSIFNKFMCTIIEWHTKRSKRTVLNSIKGDQLRK